MAHPSDFSPIAQDAFAYLVDDLGYTLVEDAWHQDVASWIVRYEKPGREVELVWGLKDVQFYFRVRRTDGDANGRRWFYIFQLMYHVEPERNWVRDLDIQTASPTFDVLNERVRANASALRDHGWAILAGDAWFDPEAGVIR